MRSLKPKTTSGPQPLLPASLRPFAVPLRGEGRRLLGNKAYSSIYEAMLPASLPPFAVPLRGEGRRLLGNKAYSSIYEAIGRGELDAIKDGGKTLLTTESIERYMRSLPPAKIKPPRPRRPNSDQRRRRKR